MVKINVAGANRGFMCDHTIPLCHSHFGCAIKTGRPCTSRFSLEMGTTAESCYFSRIPQEVICMIAAFLSETDKIALKFACPHLFIEHK